MIYIIIGNIFVHTNFPYNVVYNRTSILILLHCALKLKPDVILLITINIQYYIISILGNILGIC